VVKKKKNQAKRKSYLHYLGKDGVIKRGAYLFFPGKQTIEKTWGEGAFLGFFFCVGPFVSFFRFFFYWKKRGKTRYFPWVKGYSP